MKGRMQLHFLPVTVNPINKIYRVLKDRVQVHVLLVTVNPINSILLCAEGQEYAACSAGYCQSPQYNFTVS